MTIMYSPSGTEIDITPVNVDNMLRKGFTLEPPKPLKRPSKKTAEVTTEATDSNLQVNEA